MPQTILCISGKKGSGKNTTVNYLHGRTLKRNNVVPYYAMSEEGKLIIPLPVDDGEVVDTIIDIESNNPEMGQFLSEFLWADIKQYSFADKLKWDICIGILGLAVEQCFGTDDQKNSLTHLFWENMPGVTVVEPPDMDTVKTKSGRLGEYYKIVNDNLIYHPPGQMTAREVMQFVGTGIFREMYSDVWVDSTLRQIKEEGSALAVISDGRFPNEILGVKAVGGINLRLTRKIADDTHESEVSLDPDKFDWANFDFVIDNQNMTIDEQCDAVGTQLTLKGL